MAKKRFTFADAKEKIKELEDKLAAANIVHDDNVYEKDEVSWIKFYQYGFYILALFNILQLIF